MKDYALFWAIKEKKKKKQKPKPEFSGGSSFFNDSWEAERKQGGFI